MHVLWWNHQTFLVTVSLKLCSLKAAKHWDANAIFARASTKKNFYDDLFLSSSFVLFMQIWLHHRSHARLTVLDKGSLRAKRWRIEFVICIRLVLSLGAIHVNDTNTQRHEKCTKSYEASSAMSSTLKLLPSDIHKCIAYLLLSFRVYDSNFKCAWDIKHRKAVHVEGQKLRWGLRMETYCKTKDLKRRENFFLLRSALLSSSH